jgi:UDP-N-acetylglucosamine/UDP-N-acetylgalactosamine diphosphorylase
MSDTPSHGDSKRRNSLRRGLETRETLAERIRACDGEHQLHVLDHYDSLLQVDQQTLAAQIVRVFRSDAVGPTSVFRDSKRMSSEPPRSVEPPRPSDIVPVKSDTPESLALMHDGFRLISQGKAALVVLAGGSGSRLGVSFPKGMLECPDLAVKKSLFRLQCEKVQRAQELASTYREETADGGQGKPSAPLRIPVVYMTSPATDEQTRAYFEEQLFFGLHPTQVHFCCQSTMPCFTEAEAQIILADHAHLAEAPGGNAGVYAALGDSGVLQLLTERGVEYCQVVTVDNLIVRLVDPLFFGVAARSGGRLDVAVKTVAKAHDHEAVGVFARRVYPSAALAVDSTIAADSLRWGVVEYTEIGKELAAAKDSATGERRFNCANVGIHLFSTRFLAKAAAAMKRFSYYHIARKPIPTQLARELYHAEPDVTAIMGIKLEAFIFDLFLLVDPAPEAKAFALIQVDRSEEFSAIKNADNPTVTSKGTAIKPDSPASAVADLHALHAAWLRNAVIECRDSSVPEVARIARNVDESTFPPRVEMSPLFAALGTTDLVSRLTARPIADGPYGIALVAAKVRKHLASPHADEPLVLGLSDDNSEFLTASTDGSK